MWTIFKDFIEFVMLLLLFRVLVFWPQGIWILAPPVEIKLAPSALEGKVSTNGPSGKSFTFCVCNCL